MHPLIAFDLALLRIDESHLQAERERRLRTDDDMDDATRRVSLARRRPRQRRVRTRAAGPIVAGGLVR